MKDLKVVMKFPLIVVLWVLTSLVESVQILNIQVPDLVYSKSEVILDCNFRTATDEQDLVLKWYLNEGLVYQWIPSLTNPQSLGLLKNRVKSDPQNKSHQYVKKPDNMPLHITKVDPDLMGNFTCSVSTSEGDAKETKRMLVVVTENSFELKRLKADKGYIRVQCRADGIFPQPVMTLHSEKRELPEPIVNAVKVGHLYEISAQVTMLELEEPEEFSCSLHIPQANYTKRNENVFYPGAASCARTSKVLTILGLFLSCFVGLQHSNLH